MDWRSFPPKQTVQRRSNRSRREAQRTDFSKCGSNTFLIELPCSLYVDPMRCQQCCPPRYLSIWQTKFFIQSADSVIFSQNSPAKLYKSKTDRSQKDFLPDSGFLQLQKRCTAANTCLNISWCLNTVQQRKRYLGPVKWMIWGFYLHTKLWVRLWWFLLGQKFLFQIFGKSNKRCYCVIVSNDV